MELDENWEGFFSPAVLSRGYRYFEDGCVTRIKPVGTGWQCEVDGAERYSVFVGVDFENSSCDCPYFFDRGFCKHIAAACYEIEESLSFDGGSLKQSEGEREKPDPVELANSLDAETLRSYLLEILKADESWQSDFVRRFGKIDPTRLRLDFLEGVRATVREHSYRGYVDYRSASRCGYALSRFLDDYLAPIIDRREYGIVFDLTTQFALALQKIAIDDSSGFFSSMLHSCSHYWGIVFKADDCQLKQDMLDWMSAFIVNDDEEDDDAGVLWYIKETVEEFVCERFATDVDFAGQTRSLAERIIEQELAEPATFLAYDGKTVLPRSTHRLELWTTAKIRCMQTLGATNEDVDREIDSCPPSYGVILPLVDAALERGDTSRAQQLLEHYVDRLDEDAFSTQAALKLLDIYDQTQQMDMRLITLYGLVVNGQPRNDDQFRSWLRKLQKQSGNHWPGYEEEIEEALSGAGHKLHEFLAFTDQRSKLSQALEGYGSRYEFDHYRNLLAQDFPEEYLALYEKEVRGMLFGQAGSRNVYTNAVCLMRCMLKIPGGQPLVARIVAELREAYPRRRALMEELSQLDLSM